MNQGFCPSCDQLVDARSVERDGKVYLAKNCPTHGVSETLISGDAARYGVKRQIDVPFDYGECTLRFYSSEEYVAGGWWLGITERDGSLLRTEFLARATATPGTVRAWLEEFIGYELADTLVDSARVVIETRLRATLEADPTGVPSRVVALSGSKG